MKIQVSENTAVFVIKLLVAFVIGLMLLSMANDHAQAVARKTKAEPKLVYSFPITTWEETTIVGIPFLVDCTEKYVDQWFELRIKLPGGTYMAAKGRGFLQSQNIVWISWDDDLRLPAKTSLTFQLYTSGADKIGVKSVSLIADHAFEWHGDVPINPPEE